jgi:Protein of unknown function (DUF2510)
MNTVPPGWHPDPSNPSSGVRWWDGTAWTAHTEQSPTPVAAPYGSTPYGSAPAGPNPYAAGMYGQTNVSFAKRNSKSLTAIGVVVLYIVIALSTRVVFIGVLPVLMAARATKQKEQLAPVAIVAAVIALAVAFIGLR